MERDDLRAEAFREFEALAERVAPAGAEQNRAEL